MYYRLSTASEVFLNFTTQLCQYVSVCFLFTLIRDEPEVFLPKYSQTAILHAAHFPRVVIMAINLWNHLDEETQSIETREEFKRKLKLIIYIFCLLCV